MFSDSKHTRSGNSAYVDLLVDAVKANGNGHSLAELGQGAQGPASASELLAKVVHGEHFALPDKFWNARTYLNQIRQAARARRIVGDALLAAVLARVCLLTPHRVVLPPPGESDAKSHNVASLNSIFAVLAPSGGGKGLALGAAHDLVPFLPSDNLRIRADDVPLGSGEGIAHTFCGTISNDGKQDYGRIYDSVCVRINEGQVLKALGSRAGQTTMQTLRSGWSGEHIGFSYADRQKKAAQLEDGTYRLVVVMGVQPEYAEYVLDDSAGGTPQRFVWFQGAIDTGAPDIAPPWPGQLDWVPESSAVRLSLAAHVHETVDRDRVQALHTGQKTAGKYESHRNLLRLKLGALLGLLDQRTIVSDDDWELAGLILETSDGVRTIAEGDIERSQDSKHERSDKRAAARAQTVETAKDDIERVARWVTRKLHSLPTIEHPVPHWRLVHAINSRDRKVLDNAISRACANGWIAEAQDKTYVYVFGP